MSDQKDALVKNAGDAEQIEKAGEKEKSRRQQEIADLLWVLSTPAGRRVIWRILGRCGVNKSSFTGNSTTFFNEGMRDVGLFITAEVVDVRPEAYIEMMIEAKNRDERKKPENKNNA